MEDRVIVAVAILVAVLLVAAGLIAKKMLERGRFKQRQMGRGKSVPQSSLEPAE